MVLICIYIKRCIAQYQVVHFSINYPNLYAVLSYKTVRYQTWRNLKFFPLIIFLNACYWVHSLNFFKELYFKEVLSNVMEYILK